MVPTPDVQWPQQKILLIEDSPADIRIFRETLKDVRGFPCELVCAERLASGIERIRQEDIVLVVLDLFLPDSGGFETFARVHAEAPDVPIIVLSGLADEELAARTVREGAQDYLVKGRVDGDLLGRAMRHAVERHSAESELRDYALRLHALSRQLLQAQEQERRRIASELHDQVGQALTALKLNLQALGGAPDAKVRAERLADSVGITEDLLRQVRDLSLDLRPSVLDDLGLVPALRWYLDRQARRAGLAPKFKLDSCDRRFPVALETACFRVAQEALTNVTRHASAQQVTVELSREGSLLCLTVSDDGVGFDVAAAQKRAKRGESVGLLGMQERVQLAGGVLEIASDPGSGTRLSARFQIPP